MSDLNKMVDEVQKEGKELDKRLKGLLVKYEDLFNNGNRELIQERAASGTMNGLDDFYRFIQLIRRNRDVVGSLVRGLNNLRPLSGYKVIMEDVPEIKPKKKAKTQTVRVPVPETVEVGEING